MYSPHSSRSTSQISPRVTRASTASRMGAIMLTSEAAASRTEDRARATAPASRSERRALTRYTWPARTEASTRSRSEMRSSSMVKAFTPTTVASPASIDLWNL